MSDWKGTFTEKITVIITYWPVLLLRPSLTFQHEGFGSVSFRARERYPRETKLHSHCSARKQCTHVTLRRCYVHAQRSQTYTVLWRRVQGNRDTKNPTKNRGSCIETCSEENSTRAQTLSEALFSCNPTAEGDKVCFEKCAVVHLLNSLELVLCSWGINSTDTRHYCYPTPIV